VIDLDALIADYRAGLIADLADEGKRAHIIGDLIGQRRVHRAGRTNAVANARAKKATTPPPTEAGGFRLSSDLVAKEAEAYLKPYTKDLVERGGSMIGGKFVPWLENHTAEVRQDIADALADGIREGWGQDVVAAHLSEVVEGSRYKLARIAHTETMRIQRAGAIARYANAGAETVRRLLGPNPCPICAAEADAVYSVDEVPDDHVGGFCDFAPVISVPVDTNALMPLDEVDRLLGAEA